MARRPDDLIYAVDEWPPWPHLLLLGLQHAALIAVYLVLIVIIVRAAGASPQVESNAVSMGMIAIGIATMLQAIWKGPVGSGYLAPPVYSAIYLGPSILAAHAGGLPAVFGMTIFAGLIEVLLSRWLHRLRALFPAAVSGFIVTIVGIELGLVGMDQVLGIADYNSPAFGRHVFVSLLTLVVIVSLSIWWRGLMRLMCSMIGIAAGFLIAFPLGIVPEKSVALLAAAPVFALPDPAYISYSFDPNLVLAFTTAGLAAALRTIGVITTCQKINDADWKHPELKSIKGGMLADGLGCMFGGFMGTPGMNAGPSLVGVAKASGATSRYIAFASGTILILLSLLPKVVALFLSLPMSVIGAALVFTASFMIVGGIQIMVARNIDTRMTYVIGISMLLALSKEAFPTFFEHLPDTLQSVTSSALSMAVASAFLLNLVFRLGITKRESFVFEEFETSAEQLDAFMHAKGKSLGIPSEAIERAFLTTRQVIDHLQEAKLVQGKISIMAVYDAIDLLVEIRYEGTLLSLPHVGIKRRIFVEEESFSYGLADFLTGVYPDRLESSTKGKDVSIRLYFSA